MKNFPRCLTFFFYQLADMLALLPVGVFSSQKHHIQRGTWYAEDLDREPSCWMNTYRIIPSILNWIYLYDIQRVRKSAMIACHERSEVRYCPKTQAFKYHLQLLFQTLCIYLIFFFLSLFFIKKPKKTCWG